MSMRSDGGWDPDDQPPVPLLADPQRLHVLAESGLSNNSDPDMEYFAQRARTLLGVPVALVSLVEADQQVFPGMAGLPEPWASKRCTPLSHSFCQHVVLTAEPLVITDARDEPRVRDNLAIPDLGVVAYAGMPLTDVDGQVLGSLCAIDVQPRAWTADELDALTDLARACSTTIRLRLADHLAERERARRDEVERWHRAALARSQLLLRASAALMDTLSVHDIRLRIADLVAADLGPSYVGLTVVDGHRLQRIADPRLRPGSEYLLDGDLQAPTVSARAIRERRRLRYSNRAELDAEYPPVTQALYRRYGLHSLVCVPLLGSDGPLGAMLLGWDQPRVSDPQELAVISAIGGYAAQALERAGILQHRISVVHEMQNAMLSALPEVDGLALAARYVPADARERVGGDWYDAVLLSGAGPGAPALAVTVGDIIGHTVHAATIMGQVRSMMRQAGWERAGRAPSEVVTAVETACVGLGVDAAGTAVHARLERLPNETGEWSMIWSNAGHPPPILVHPDGTTDLLTEHDMLFGFPHLMRRSRTDHRMVLAPGSTVVLHTDGLIESRQSDIDHGTEVLRALLTRHHGLAPQELVDILVTSMVGDQPDDDVVAMAVQLS
jgi:serine phosphatase RsbU (regulator of sigma subunit)/GAF domain-containing protein